RDARETFQRLLTQKTEDVRRRRGGLEVAMAIAATTGRVRLDASGAPVRTTPNDLLARTFNDSAIALDRGGVKSFKGNLISLLPGIAADIQAIPEDPALNIGDVAHYIALSLAASSRKSGLQARPRTGRLTVMRGGPLHEARERVKNQLGTQFAAKASDNPLLALGREFAMRESSFAALAPAAFAPSALGAAITPAAFASAGGPSQRWPLIAGSLILELQSASPPAAPGAPGARERALREAARLVDRETVDRRVGTPLMLRQTQLAPLRDAFYKSVAPLYAEIGRRAGRDALLESLGSRRTLDVCWLNETIRTAVAPQAIAEVASDQSITRIGVPRRLVREMNLCAPLVGAPAFRTRTKKDGAGIVVAIIDGEIDVRHPALAGRVMQKRNLTREAFGFPDDHATGVAGIIGPHDERFGGIAPGVSLLNYKVFTTNPALDSDDFDGALAIQQALEDGAHVVNISWGAGRAGNGKSRQAKACDRAWSLGLVLVKSAGNDGPNG